MKAKSFSKFINEDVSPTGIILDIFSKEITRAFSGYLGTRAKVIGNTILLESVIVEDNFEIDGKEVLCTITNQISIEPIFGEKFASLIDSFEDEGGLRVANELGVLESPLEYFDNIIASESSTVSCQQLDIFETKGGINDRGEIQWLSEAFEEYKESKDSHEFYNVFTDFVGDYLTTGKFEDIEIDEMLHKKYKEFGGLLDNEEEEYDDEEDY